MAHAGKVYQLHNRRDACLGCTNYRGSFPRHRTVNFNLQLFPHPVISYLSIDTPLWLVSDPWDLQMEWASPLINQNGKTIQLRIHFHDWVQADQTTRCRLEVLANTGIVLSLTVPNSFQRCGGFGRDFTQSEPGVTYDAEYWGRAAFFCRYESGGMPWGFLREHGPPAFGPYAPEANPVPIP